MTDTGHGRGMATRWGMWLLVAGALANAAWYVRDTAWGLIASDNWNHVHPLLRDLFAGELGPANFFIQRAGVDHAQPLMKLLMVVNARWFGLDFMLEGLLGIVFAALALLVLYRVLVADAPDGPRPLAFRLGFVAVAAVFLSLNSRFIYIYSMVTMWFSLYACVFMVVWAAWHALQGGRRWPLAVAAFLLGVVADDSAVIDLAAVSLALVLSVARAGPLRAVAPPLAAIALGLLASRGLYWLYGSTSGATQAVFNQPLPVRVAGLAAQAGDAWSWFAVPASSGLVGGEALHALVGDHMRIVRQALAVLMLAAHGWFWWSAWRLRPGAAWLASVTLMLMFYAHVAAILVARVFVRGVAYLDQSRYVSFYQFGVIALLLMAMAWLLQSRGARWPRWSFAAVAVGVIGLQFALSGVARDAQPYVQANNRKMAMDLAMVARDPTGPVPADCFPGMDICVLPPERRAELVHILRTHRLQLFSEQYLRRHPDQREAAALARGEGE